MWVGKHLFIVFPVRDSLKIGDDLLPLLFKFALNTPIGGLRLTRKIEVN